MATAFSIYSWLSIQTLSDRWFAVAMFDYKRVHPLTFDDDPTIIPIKPCKLTYIYIYINSRIKLLVPLNLHFSQVSVGFPFFAMFFSPSSGWLQPSNLAHDWQGCSLALCVLLCIEQGTRNTTCTCKCLRHGSMFAMVLTIKFMIEIIQDMDI